ncbi:MAG: hypothetical protein LJF04_12440 [Gemmatimonadetes bacterium]|nr:hypothetical protein [Gemmatimonadota bacterium]
MKLRWGRALLGLGVFLAAMAPRLSTWAGTFRGPLVLLEEVDGWYHLRRIELALANGLILPAVDTYNNHPFGGAVDWPPGFDVLFALVWHLLSNVAHVAVSPAAVGAVGVAVLGSLAAAALAVVGARWGVWAGIAAGLSVAWSPAAVAYSRVGRLDHHAIEPLGLVVLCATYAWARRRSSATRTAALGVVMAAGTLFWPGLALYAAVLAVAFAGEVWTAGGLGAGADKGRGLAGAASPGAQGPESPWGGEAPVVRQGALAYVVAAAVSAGLAFTSPWGRDLQVVYYALSWFQPLLFGALALAFGAVYGLRTRGVSRARAWSAVGLGLGAAAVLVVAVRSGSVGRGVDFLFGTDTISATLLESRSLAGMGAGYALRWLTPVGLAVPLLWLAAVAVTVRRRERMTPLLAAALALSTLAAPFAFLQVRFGPHAAVASGLLLAWLVGRAKRRLVAGGALVVAAGLLAWGVRPATLPGSEVHPYLLGGFDALAWLRRQAPPTSHFLHPVERAEYGVAAEWVWGHWITEIGQKPNIANPLSQTPENRRGIDDVARLFMAESEEEALDIAQRRDVRYLLLSAIPVTVSQLAVQAGRDPARYVTPSADEPPTFHPPFFRIFHSRLYLGGSAETGDVEVEPVSRVRLVFESRARIDFLGPRPTVRIFEIVRGALLRGQCAADEVEVHAALEGRPLEYVYRTHADSADAFALRVPYASEGTDASIPGRVTVRCGERETEVQVAEQDVREGRDVWVASTPNRDRGSW